MSIYLLFHAGVGQSNHTSTIITTDVPDHVTNPVDHVTNPVDHVTNPVDHVISNITKLRYTCVVLIIERFCSCNPCISLSSCIHYCSNFQQISSATNVCILPGVCAEETSERNKVSGAAIKII